jgi:hypothetical protein
MGKLPDIETVRRCDKLAIYAKVRFQRIDALFYIKICSALLIQRI